MNQTSNKAKLQGKVIISSPMHDIINNSPILLSQCGSKLWRCGHFWLVGQLLQQHTVLWQLSSESRCCMVNAPLASLFSLDSVFVLCFTGQDYWMQRNNIVTTLHFNVVTHNLMSVTQFLFMYLKCQYTCYNSSYFENDP